MEGLGRQGRSPAGRSLFRFFFTASAPGHTVAVYGNPSTSVGNAEMQSHWRCDTDSLATHTTTVDPFCGLIAHCSGDGRFPACTSWFHAIIVAVILLTQQSFAEPIVPGTGVAITKVGDDFESSSWAFSPNYPKSSRNIDDEERAPLGTSRNKRWLEGPHRGTPDIMRRVPTPPSGLDGSQYSLLMRSQRTGIPGKVTNKPQQDDVMVKVKRRVGRPIPADWSPNCVVRVYVPPFDEWENRSGASFGFRTDCWGRKPGSEEVEQFWPGIFFNFRSSTDRNISADSASMALRSDTQGRDSRGPQLEPGWWTLGLSVSPDGKCHFYAKPGVDNLTEDDHLGSYFCYGYRVERMDLFFFNIVSFDNGRQWSTPWVIDNPQFFCTPSADNQRRASRPITRRR